MEHIKRERPAKHQDYGHSLRRYVPYQNLQTNQQTNQAQQGAQQQQNTFTPGQTALQGNLGNLWQSFLGGNIPQSFTAPQAAFDAFNTNFNTQTAPGLAANYGAGSPVLNSQRALGTANLAGQLYNTGVGNFMNALGGGTNYALGMPTGGMGTQAQQGTGTMDQTQTSGINPLAFLANMIFGATRP